MTQDTVVSVSLQKGLETKTDLKQGVNGRLLALENAVFTGVTDIEKRNGYTSLPATVYEGSNIAAGNSLNTFKGNLVETDNQYLYDYSSTDVEWVNSGNAQSIGISSTTLSGLVDGGSYPASATLGGYKLTLNNNPLNLADYNFTYSDAITNVPITQVEVTQPGITSLIAYQVLPFAGKFAAIVTGISTVSNNGTFLKSFPAVPGTLPTSVATIATATIATAGQYVSSAPVMVASASNLFLLFTDPSSNLTINKYDSSFAFVSQVVVSTIANLGSDIIIDLVNSELVVAYTTAAAVIVKRYDFNLALLSTVTTLSALRARAVTIGIINSTSLSLIFEQKPATSAGFGADFYYMQPYLLATYRTSPALTAWPIFGYPTYLYSRTYVRGSKAYVCTIHVDPLKNQPVQFITEVNYTQNLLNACSIVAKFANGTAFLGYTSISNVGLVSWDNLSLPYLNANQTTIQAGDIGATYVIDEITLNFSLKLNSIELGNNLNLQGGTTKLFDGLQTVESGFNLFPIFDQVAISGGTGTPANYEYTAIYVWTDFQGNTHRSAPFVAKQLQSPAPIGNTGADAQIQITIDSIGVTEYPKVAQIIVQLYRTTNNGTIFYVVGSAPNMISTNNCQVAINDNISDADLQGNTQLYTTGGEVENIGPSPLMFLNSFKNRVIGVDSNNPYTWWYSKQILPGFPAEFSDLFTQNIDQKGGPITALSTMDDKLVFFKNTNIWYVIGDGPAPDGSSNDFTYPQIISSDTGCVNQDSIILTPKGLMFQSPKGIYLLDRGLGMSYTGAPVEAYNNFTVTSAQMIAGTTQIRFTLNTSIILVYDYLVDQWSSFTNLSGVDAVIYKGNHTYLGSNGIVHTETPGSYLDDTTVIPMNFTTGWIKLSDIQGFERFKKMLVIGTSVGVSTLDLSFNYNYDSLGTQDISPIPVAANQTRMQYRVFPPRQKCEAFQLVFTETPAALSAGVTQVSNLALEIGLKKGPFKLPAASSFG